MSHYSALDAHFHLKLVTLTPVIHLLPQRYCPDGNVPIAIPDGTNIWELIERNGDIVENQHWAPLGGLQKGWVQVGWRERETCKTDKQSHEDQSWETSRFDALEVTGYLMCCLKPSSINDSLSSTEATTAEVTATASATSATSVEPRPMSATSSPSDNPISSPTSSPELTPAIWYDRSTGWSGQTYDEAVDFCKSKKNAKGKGMMLCEFDAYCPLGLDSTPIGPYKKDMVWAPIANGPNRWIGLSADIRCKEYTAFYSSEPAWGLTGDYNEEITRHVMCCPDLEVIKTPEISSIPTASADSTVDKSSQDSSVNDEFRAVYDIVNNQFHSNLQPILHSRHSGWTGHTYSEALKFCNSNESNLCPYESFCPNGTGGAQPTIDFLDGPVWMPIDGIVNMWVEMRDRGQCTVHTTLSKFDDVTRYVFCCETVGKNIE